MADEYLVNKFLQILVTVDLTDQIALAVSLRQGWLAGHPRRSDEGVPQRALNKSLQYGL
jgi:hypothetical protein